MSKTFRKGAKGALLDEYERAVIELQTLVATIPDDHLTLILDPLTEDENCRSLQMILTHVVYAGFGYATAIHNVQGPPRDRPAKINHLTTREYIQDLSEVFLFTEKVFQTIGEEDLLQYEESRKIKTRWGQSYDIEQLMEHAIVHILRHRRQIERLYVMN